MSTTEYLLHIGSQRFVRADGVTIDGDPVFVWLSWAWKDTRDSRPLARAAVVGKDRRIFDFDEVPGSSVIDPDFPEAGLQPETAWFRSITQVRVRHPRVSEQLDAALNEVSELYDRFVEADRAMGDATP